MYRSVMKLIFKIAGVTFFAADDSTAHQAMWIYWTDGSYSCRDNTKCHVHKWFYHLIGPIGLARFGLSGIFPAHGHGFPQYLVGTWRQGRGISASSGVGGNVQTRFHTYETNPQVPRFHHLPEFFLNINYCLIHSVILSIFVSDV